MSFCCGNIAILILFYIEPKENGCFAVWPQGVAREGPLLSPLTIQTGPVAAAVQLLLTVGAGVAGGAAAGVASGHRLHTGAPVEAGTICTRHGDDLTVLSIEALRAGA